MKQKKTLTLAGIFIAIVVIFASIFFITRPTTEDGMKEYTLEVVQADGSSVTHELKTEDEYLGDALLDEGIIEGTEGEYGLFITTVDGIKANDSNKEWWSFTINGEPSSYGVDQTPVIDGEHYELTLTVGW